MKNLLKQLSYCVGITMVLVIALQFKLINVNVGLPIVIVATIYGFYILINLYIKSTEDYEN